MAFPSGSGIKNLSAMQEMQEMWVWSLGREAPLEKCMAIHFCILVWRILWTEEPGGLWSIGSQRIGHDWSDLACMHALNYTVKSKEEFKCKARNYKTPRRKHRQNTLWHKSQQDPQWPTSQNIGNKSKNKWDLIKIKSFYTIKESDK